MAEDLQLVAHYDQAPADDRPRRRLVTVHLPVPMWLGAALLAEVAAVYPDARVDGDGGQLHVTVADDPEEPA